ncbi:MAG: sugar phosphate nucleotidyltransferase [Deinococcales bacterium]
MNYICLAAGKGSRFGSLGSYLQKCMYPIALKPFLEYSIRNLRQISDPQEDSLSIVVGHHAEQIRAYFGDDYHGLKIKYTVQAEPLGTAHALHEASKKLRLKAPIICWLADLYVTREMFIALKNHPLDNVHTIAKGHQDEAANLRVSIVGERLSKVWCGDSDFLDIGLWKFSPEILKELLQVSPEQSQQKEYRILPAVDDARERLGYQLGYVKAAVWLHLGGVTPSPEENVLSVVAKVLALEGLSLEVLR